MKKDLESWLRGEMPQAAEAPASGVSAADVPDTGTPDAGMSIGAADLRLPVVAVMTEREESRQAENSAGEALNNAADELAAEGTAPETQAMPDEEAAEEAEPADGGLVEDGSVEENNFVPVENFPQGNYEAEEEAAAPAGEPEEQGTDAAEDGEGVNADYEKPPVPEAPEQSGSSIGMRLKQMKEMQRAAYMYEQEEEFRRFRRRRIAALCVLAALIIGAAALLYRVLRRDPYDTMMDRARVLYEQKEYAASFEAYSGLSLEYSDRAEPLLGAARSAGGMGRVDDAITAYRACMERFPAGGARSKSGVLYEIGRLYATLKAWENARGSFEEAIAADDSNYGAHFSLGDAFEAQGQPDRALLAYKQALNLSPYSDAAMEAVQRLSFALDSGDETGKKEETEAAAENDYGQALSSGNSALKDARYGEASKYFAEALAISSDDANAWAGFAEARSKLGDRAGAVKSFERALERDPEHELAKSRLAEIEAQNKKNTTGTNPARRKNSSSRRNSSSQSAAKNDTPKTQPVLSKNALFDAGVELYRNEEYAKALDSFIACLRSSDGGLAAQTSLAGGAGPMWKGNQVKLSIPPNARILVESVRLNPADRNLYVNLSMAAAKLDLDGQAMRSLMNEARSHAIMTASK